MPDLPTAPNTVASYAAADHAVSGWGWALLLVDCVAFWLVVAAGVIAFLS